MHRRAEAPLAARSARLRSLLPGLVPVLVLAVVATLLGRVVPLVGAPVLGIVLGALVGVFRRPGERQAPGLRLASRGVLQAGVVLLGTGLPLGQVLRVGGGSLPVMLGTLAVALAGAATLGRLLGLPSGIRTLVGVGTGICGASAIAAVTSVLSVAEADVAYAIGTIFTYNVAAVLAFPAIGHLLGLSQHAFGLWAGTAVNDTSSVVAAAYSYGTSAGSYAVVVKLTRSLMIVPICLLLAALSARRRTSDGVGSVRPWRLVPPFIVGFVLASIVDTLGLVPSSWHGPLTWLAVFCTTVALSSIGLTTDPAALRRAGARPLMLGGLLWVLVAVSSLGLQAVTGTL
ncbi:MAG TPA: putative sulfate exporter family transporter [Motilibacteraceae bacterium]|nr:putative sulfate exporter family transporter [Motilibacteraceae bacterium]